MPVDHPTLGEALGAGRADIADGAALRSSQGGAAVGTARKGDLFRVIERSAAGWRVVRPFGKGEAWISSDAAGGWSPG
jgi:hypothetical protein